MVDHHDFAAAGVRDPAAGAGAVKDPDAQDLSLVWALLAFLAGIILGNRTAPKDPPG